MTAPPTVLAPDFADVYAEQLDRVWRFVRARVPDHHEAHDITSDVFVRAWRSWDRFDPTRGAVEPWLFTIAHRTVTDWYRRRRCEPVGPGLDRADPAIGPEDGALRDELLVQLGGALETLTSRERDALALRFAARLKNAHIARVLGTTEGAAKMMVHRAIRRLRSEGMDQAVVTDTPAADLEALIDGVLARGHASMADAELEGLLMRVATLHDAPVPSDLSGDVALCVRCAALEEVSEDATEGATGGGASGGGASGGARARGRGRLANGAAALLAFTGACLVCTVPALATLAFALGISSAVYVAHLVGVVAAPFVAWFVWRGVRRHGRDRGFRIARVGALLMMVHLASHLAWETGAIEFVDGDVATTISGIASFIGTTLLVLGAGLNLVDTQGWRRQQGRQLQAAVARSA